MNINSKYASYQRFERELNVNKFMVNEVMREQYDEPYFLYHEEFKTILKTDVPESLSSTKDAFLLQCAIGCRISDFRKPTMDNIAITEDIIRRRGFDFDFVRHNPGTNMHKKKIKKLLEYCKINRIVSRFNEASGKMERVSLC